MQLVDSLREHAPRVYRAGMSARRALLQARNVGRHKRALALFDGSAVTVCIAGDVGMGGVLDAMGVLAWGLQTA